MPRSATRPALRRSLLLAVATMVAAVPALEADARVATPRMTSTQAGKLQLPSSLGADAACRKRAAGRRCAVRRGVRAAIVGGYTPHPSQWPWMTHLRLHDKVCGGSLIRPEVVLTAAHCVTDANGSLRLTPSQADATIGRRTLSDSSTGERIGLVDIVPHPQYGGRATWANDVALLLLSRPSSARPAVLGTHPEDWRSPATAMGWGRTTEDGAPSDSLLAADLPLQGDAACAATYPTYDGNVMMCAGGDGRDTCQGDSGGPLMSLDAAGAWKQIGVTSFGDGCGRIGTPGVYAWVSGPALRAWITARADQLTAGDSNPAGGSQPDGGGPSPGIGGANTAAPDTTAPAILTMRLMPGHFRAVRHGARATRTPVGTVVRLHLSEPGTVRFTVVRRGGRRVASLVNSARAGMNRFPFSGRIRGRRLRPGRYVLKARAFDPAGNASVVESVRFRIAG